MLTQTATRPQTTTASWQWHSHDFRAMNTTVYARLFSQTDAAVLHDVERLFASFERRLSRFLPHSELSQLNAAPTERFKASPTLIGAVQVALWAAQLTHGLYDPTILTYLEQAGYNRSFEQVPNPRPLSTHDDLAGSDSASAPVYRPYSFQSVQVNRAGGTIDRPVGVRLDLGGMGKGYTVDRAADRLQGLGPFLVNAGGDIFAYQSPPGQKGWQINLVHPLQPGLSMARLYLHHGAIATSTIAKRRWQHQGQVMHHLINPRTGQPARTDALSVSVIANRTVLAEVHAKVALILGAEAGLAYLQQTPGIDGLIYTAQHQILTTEGMASRLERVDPAGYDE
jgi:thiamine biosynthesis lipoprotein